MSNEIEVTKALEAIQKQQKFWAEARGEELRGPQGIRGEVGATGPAGSPGRDGVGPGTAFFSILAVAGHRVPAAVAALPGAHLAALAGRSTSRLFLFALPPACSKLLRPLNGPGLTRRRPRTAAYDGVSIHRQRLGRL